MSNMTLRDVRREFPVTESCVYLDTAYRGPYPTRGARAMSSYVERWSREAYPDGRTEEQLAWTERVRAKVASLWRVTPEEVLFTRSTTDGLHLVASSLLKPGDEILVGGLDHPANYATWMHLADTGIKVTLVPHRDGAIATDDLLSAIGPRTRAVGMCLVNTYNGYRQDLESLGQLCSDHGLYLLLDGVQAVGHLDIKLPSAGVTMLCAGAYKWLCAPEGLGVSYIDRQVVEALPPATPHLYKVSPRGDPGWQDFMATAARWGNDDAGPQALEPGLLDYPLDSRRLETSWSFLALAGLEAVVDLMADFGGMAAVEASVLELSALLRDSVREHGHALLSTPPDENLSGITSVAVSDARLFAEYCQDRGIWVLASRSLRGDSGAVRVSPHLFNNTDDIARFTETLDSFVSSKT